MQSWLAQKLIRFVMARLNAGDVRPVLMLDAPEVELTFPGESSWSGVVRGKPQLRAWLERFARVGLQIYADEVVVKGFPWRQTICIRGWDHFDTPAGERIYENRYVIWGELRWFRMRRYEVYEDTKRPEALDAWLADHEPRLAAAA
jgi:ketosteroid isomerase-like protein